MSLRHDGGISFMGVEQLFWKKLFGDAWNIYFFEKYLQTSCSKKMDV